MRLSKKILLGTSAIIILVNATVLQLVAWRYEVELRESLTESARSFYRLVVVVRAWVAHNEGVFIHQRPGVEPNPYLSAPVLRTVDGDSLVWRNPAMVTRELSELSQEMGMRVQFHVTSLDPVNPANAPTAFERQALLALERRDPGRLSPAGEFTQFEEIDGARHFRYFAPLLTEGSCLRCHDRARYEVGDVRGGISIIMPTDQLSAAVAHSQLLTLLGGLTASGAVSLLLFGLIQRTVIRPLRRLEDAAHAIGNGNYDTEIPADSEDEIGDVGRAMARMQRAIRLSVSRQVETEKMFALGQLSAGIAHEIRNPLFAIRNDLDYLRRSGTPDAVQAEVYQEMEEGLDRIGGIVSAVLGYAKPHRLEYGRHTLHEVLRRCLALLGKQLQQEGIQVVARLDEAPPVEMDVHQMEQVFVNLLANAMTAHAGRPGQVRVVARPDGEDAVEVRIEDDGAGIDPADLPYIFDPFYSRSPNGTGLGLSIVRRVLDQHHGSIRAESEPGRGTAFILRLPVEQPHLQGV